MKVYTHGEHIAYLGMSNGSFHDHFYDFDNFDDSDDFDVSGDSENTDDSDDSDDEIVYSPMLLLMHTCPKRTATVA